MARAICNLDMGSVYIGVASYLPRRERWRPWPRGWLQDEGVRAPRRRVRITGRAREKKMIASRGLTGRK